MKIKILIYAVIISFCAVGSLSAKVEIDYDDGGKRDPFWPLVTPSGTITSYDSDILISDMMLEGIMAGADGQNLAIINGIIVKKNDKVGLYKVQDISKNSVILLKGPEKFVLQLKKEE